MQEPLSLGLRKWEDMNLDILQKIFSKVPSSDLSRNVTSVCRSWQLGCWYTLCWTKNVFNLSVIKSASENLNSSTMKLLKSIFEDKDKYGIYLQHWRLSIKTILIPGDLEISDNHLLYIAERTIGLKHLDLSESSRITMSGLMKAMCNWKNLQYINLQQVKYHYFSQIVDELNQNGCGLETISLRLNELSRHDYRTLIIINMFLDIVKHGSSFKQTDEVIWASFFAFDSKVFEPHSDPPFADIFYSYPFNITLKLRGKEGNRRGSYEDDASESICNDNERRLERAYPVLVCLSLEDNS